MNLNNVEIKEVEINDRPEYAIRMLNSEFENITFKYGEVKFLEDDNQDHATLSFEYDIIEGQAPQKVAEFEKMIGDLLLNILEQQLLKHEVVFKGGTSEE